MFAIFVLTLLSLALFPYTIYRFCNGGNEEEGVVKPWQVLTAYCVLHWLLAASDVTLPNTVVSACCVDQFFRCNCAELTPSVLVLVCH